MAAGVEGVAGAVPAEGLAAGSTAADGFVVGAGVGVPVVVAGGTTAAGTLADLDSLPQLIAPVTETSINAVPSATLQDVKFFMTGR